MKQSITYFICLLLALSTTGTAQSDSTFLSTLLLDDLEFILNSTEEEETLIPEEFLEQLILSSNEHKVNINSLSYEVAVNTLHLTEYQYYQLQLYIETYGELMSVYELEAIDGFNKSELVRLRPHIEATSTRSKKRFFKEIFTKSSSTLLVRYDQVLEKQAGYDTARSNHYDGSPGHACFRYNFNSQDKLILKLSGEKDAGEQFFKGKQRYGFDLYTGSVSVQNVGIVRQAVLGDYRLNFGQGLIAGSALLSGKGGDPASVRRFSTGIRAIAPANEGDFLRGGATTLGNTKWQGTLFAGRNFGTTRNALGVNIEYRHRLFSIGFRGVAYSQSDTSQQTIAERLKSSFQFTSGNLGISYHALIRRTLLFGEIAIDNKARWGLLQALLTNLTPTTRITALFRHYATDFQNPLGHAFGSNSRNNAETGIYLSINHILHQKWQFTAYCDYYRFHAPTYRTDAPVAGSDFGFNLEYNINRQSFLSLKYNLKSKPENSNETPYFRTMREHNRHQLRVQCHYAPLPYMKLKTVCIWQINRYPMQAEQYRGILLYQDVGLQIPKPKISANLRIAFFDTDRYEERLYAYEDDVYYAFTVGSYYYKGIRGYVVLSYAYKWLSVWFRISQTYYLDRNSISSGLTLIEKPHKTEIKIQTMVRI